MPDILDKAAYKDRVWDIRYFIWSSIASHPKTRRFQLTNSLHPNETVEKSNRSDIKLSGGEQIRANKMQFFVSVLWSDFWLAWRTAHWMCEHFSMIVVPCEMNDKNDIFFYFFKGLAFFF